MLTNYLRLYYSYHKKNSRDDVLEYVNIIKEENFDRDKLIAAFRKNRLDISAVPERILHVILHGNGLSKEEHLEQLKALDVKMLHAPDWFGLSSVLIGLRKLSGALILREKGLDRINYYQNRHDSFFFVDLIIGKSIERFEFKNLGKYLKIAWILRTAAGKSKFNKKLKNFIKGRKMNYSSNVENLYAEYVKDKLIAIVGPLELGEKEREEIKFFDIVITVNDFYFGREELQENRIQSDVVYITGRMLERLHEIKHIPKDRKTPDFINGKWKMDFPKYLQKRIKFRTIDQYNYFVVNGGFNLIPRVVTDLIMFKPKKIKVFGADLYASKQYSTNYDAKSGLNSWDRIYNTFINHDIITQFKYMHNIYKYGFIEAEDRLKKVLEMDLEEYLNFFEDRVSQKKS